MNALLHILPTSGSKTAQINKKQTPFVFARDSVLAKQKVSAEDASMQLFRIKGFWPFDLFPDELILEEKRIILKRNYFPWFSHITTIPIDRVALFEVSHSWFFSALYIQGGWWGVGSRYDTITMRWLRHADAQKAKDIVDGLRIKNVGHLELPQAGKKEIVTTLERIGKT